MEEAIKAGEMSRLLEPASRTPNSDSRNCDGKPKHAECREEPQRIQPLDAARSGGRTGNHPGGENHQKRQQKGGSRIVRCSIRRFPTRLARCKPRNSLDDAAETDTDSAEGDPADLRVKAAQRDLPGTGIPDQDQRGDAHGVQ
jgi:hypothetical protein